MSTSQHMYVCNNTGYVPYTAGKIAIYLKLNHRWQDKNKSQFVEVKLAMQEYNFEFSNEKHLKIYDIQLNEGKVVGNEEIMDIYLDLRFHT